MFSIIPFLIQLVDEAVLSFGARVSAAAAIGRRELVIAFPPGKEARTRGGEDYEYFLYKNELRLRGKSCGHVIFNHEYEEMSW